MKILGKMFSVATLLFICGILFGLSQCQAGEWEKFKKKHLTSQSVAAFNCTITMNDPLYTPDGLCKEFNTFIHSNTGPVKEICRGVIRGEDKSSSQKFSLTNCSRTVRCEYSQSRKTNYICIHCRNNVPIHFVKIGKCKK